MDQALGLAGVVGGGFSSIINEIAGSFAITNKLRDFALKAASPVPPPIPAQPESTSSAAAITPASGSGKNPYATAPTSPKLPAPVTSVEDLNKMLNASTTSTSQPLNTDTENYNIMNQIGGRNTTTDLQNFPLVSG
jgi:hypothetical protein